MLYSSQVQSFTDDNNNKNSSDIISLKLEWIKRTSEKFVDK